MTRPQTLFKEAYNASLRLIAEGEALASEADLAARLGISRTTVRAVLRQLTEAGLVAWDSRSKRVLRRPAEADYFPPAEIDPMPVMIERAFMRWILSDEVRPGARLNEADLAREIGVSTSAIREFLQRFSRFGLIEKQPNRHWVLRGFTADFALELFEVREMFELRSARAFLRLPRDHAAWARLAAIEAEHRTLLDAIETRYRDFSELDDRFHRLIHTSSSNRFIIDFYEVIALVFHYHYQWSKQGEKQRNRVAVVEHLAYIAGLRRGDEAEVEEACRRHLASARETLLQSIRG